ncbi:MAG: sugar ABC transporter permease [Acidobacteriaceae bacterium]
MTKRQAIPYVFLTPVMLFGVVFFVLPIGFAFYLTFTNFQAFVPHRGVGLLNYKYLLARDPFFFQTMRNTAVFALGSLALEIPIALIVAYTISKSRFRAFWRSIYWLPMATNVVAIAFVWKFLLDGPTGLLNRILDVFGLPGPGWLTDPKFAMLSVILVFVWMTLGSNMLLLSAGMEGIDESSYEAARMDGANTFHILTRVAIPLLKPTLLFVMTTDLIVCLSSFPLMLVLTEGGPAQTTTVTALYMYQMAFANLRLGRASAAAFILFLLILAVTMLQLRLFRRGGIDAY